MRVADLFAGWGGFSLGAEQAGCRVIYAANHWELAVEAHRHNHPGVQHECQDLRQADWSSLPRYDLLLASPDCRYHSTASQPRRPKEAESCRQTAWAIVDCAEVTQPKAIIVENVPQFSRWTAPGSADTGNMFRHWIAALQLLGYHVATDVLRASRFGVPQRRDRLFIVATRRSGFRFPVGMTAEPGFGPCVDWGSGRWRAFAEASPGARGRLEASRRHGSRALVQHVTGHRGLHPSEPLRTVTRQDQWHVVKGRRYRPLTVRETARAMGFPDDYGWPSRVTRSDAITGLGAAVPPPVARAVVGAVISHVR